MDDIEDMEDEEDMQDHLEIHFQKPSNYGGEIESVKYISKGKVLRAFFLCDSKVEIDVWLQHEPKEKVTKYKDYRGNSS